MRADRRTGVILMLVGVGVPLALLPFAWLDPERGFLGSLPSMSIVLWQTKPEIPCPPPKKSPLFPSELFSDSPPCYLIPAEYFEIPYRYFFALGVVLFLGGLGVLILGNMGNKGG